MKVVVAIIFNEKQHVLLTQRAQQGFHAGLWEFPGGKVEPSESDFQALVRELREEIAITVSCYQSKMTYTYTYPDRHIDFTVFIIDSYAGTPSIQEDQQNMQWVDLDAIVHYPLLEANQAMLAFAKAHVLGVSGLYSTNPPKCHEIEAVNTR